MLFISAVKRRRVTSLGFTPPIIHITMLRKKAEQLSSSQLWHQLISHSNYSDSMKIEKKKIFNVLLYFSNGCPQIELPLSTFQKKKTFLQLKQLLSVVCVCFYSGSDPNVNTIFIHVCWNMQMPIRWTGFLKGAQPLHFLSLVPSFSEWHEACIKRERERKPYSESLPRTVVAYILRAIQDRNAHKRSRRTRRPINLRRVCTHHAAGRARALTRRMRTAQHPEPMEWILKERSVHT